MSKRLKRRKVLDAGFIVGLLTVLAGFGYEAFFAGVPYQDPTEQMTRDYEFHQSVGQTVELIGVVLMLLSLVGSVLNKFGWLARSGADRR